MRRWTLLLAGAALWLFLAAIPALADGGPHVAKNNSGESTLTADSCAGCHRAHTAQGAMLLKTSEEALCLSCHGTSGTGATTNVEDGVQYAILGTGLRDSGTTAGALRAGGFVNARISAEGAATITTGAGSPSPVVSRKSYPRANGASIATSYSAQVPALSAGKPVTSAHLHVGTSGFSPKNTAWGYGDISPTANPGVSVTLECTSCHNPHGNDQYRILKKFTTDQAPPSGIAVVAAPGKLVADVRANPTGAGAAGVRNYTVKWGATLDDVLTNPNLNPDSATGDYWRRLQPYSSTPTESGGVVSNPAGYFRGDIAEFVPGQATTSSAWRTAISNWCSTCHTRYHTALNGTPASGLWQTQDSGDAIFKYRHGTSNSECTQCHVSHGSNAVMDSDPGTDGLQGNAANFPYPDTSLSASSRLLKVGNRGTCQMCHDPTGTYLYNSTTLTVTH